MGDKVLEPFEGAVVAITGCSRGLGRALAVSCGAHGARVLAHARSDADLAEVVAAVEEAGAPAVAGVAGDLLGPDLGVRIAATAQGRWGKLDALILSAAVLGPMARIEDTVPEELGRAMAVNVEAQLRLFQACLPLMRRNRRGVVVWLSSLLGRTGLPRYGVYAATKHALEGLMKVAAAEHGDEGIVNVAMAPGMVQTEMLNAALGGGDLSEHQTPEETAEAFVRFLREVHHGYSGASLDIAPWLAS